jgi:glucose-1-phosphate thymidylyltransferase
VIESGGSVAAHARSKPIGIILLGGTGSRVKGITGGANKHLIRIGERTLAERALDFLARSGISDVVAVSSPADHPALEELLTAWRERAVRLRWALQPKPLGTAHAVSCTVSHLGSSNVVVLFGDNLFELPQTGIAEPLPSGVRARLYLSESPHPENFGVITLAPGGAVTAIDCKPAVPAARTVCTGLMCFTAEALRLIPALSPDARGELDLMSLVREVWHRGGLSWRAVQGKWTDCASHTGAVADARLTFAR